MAAKQGRPLGKAHDERTRDKIKTSQLINRLVDHALGNVEMKSTQIRACEILLNKTLPNLQATTGGDGGPIEHIIQWAKGE